jgi:hypothetical protein
MYGAGYQNRTDDGRLEIYSFTIKLIPLVNWSEYKDSNLGPPGPKPGALPDCATLRILVDRDGLEPPTYAV